MGASDALRTACRALLHHCLLVERVDTSERNRVVSSKSGRSESPRSY